MSKLVIAVLFSLLQIFYPEVFPTEIRSQALGLIMGIGLIGVLIIPFIVDFASRNLFSPLFILSGVGFLGCISLVFLHETLNRPLLHKIKQLSKEDETNTEETD